VNSTILNQRQSMIGLINFVFIYLIMVANLLYVSQDLSQGIMHTLMIIFISLLSWQQTMAIKSNVH
jgi:hypothetical protein